MENKLVSASKCEHCAIICFLNAEGISRNETHKRLCDVYGEENTMNRLTMYKWIRMFNEGRTTLHDKERSGHPADAVSDETVAIVGALLEDDHRLTVSDLFNKIAAQYPYVEVSRKSVYRILKEKLGMKKVCARWVLRQLTDENCKKRMGSALALKNEMKRREMITSIE